MVKRSEIGVLGAALRRSNGLSAESEALGLSSRVRRAASSLQMQSEETVLDRYGPTKTAILTMLLLLLLLLAVAVLVLAALAAAHLCLDLAHLAA